MITVPEATKKIIERSRYLSEAISKGLINYSSLARYMKPEIEQMLIKNVSVPSIMMALKRLEKELKPNPTYNKVFIKKPEIIIRSNLVLISISNKIVLDDSIEYLFENHGVSESSRVISQDNFAQLTIQKKDILVFIPNLSALSIKLPKEALKTPGIYYFFLKSLAWEGINIIELSSTPNEVTIVVEDRDIERAFSIVNSLFVE
jgi:aspartokinase